MTPALPHEKRISREAGCAWLMALSLLFWAVVAIIWFF
jgi:hypothetical protein